MNPAAGAALLIAGCAVAACASEPCSPARMRRTLRASGPYVGRWVVARGDSLTLPTEPRLADRFRIATITLDTQRVVLGNTCVLAGALVLEQPRPETLAVGWFGQVERAIVQGWPADVGPFAGLALEWYGRDSLRGSLLFDQRLGVQLPAGVTARFVAGRAP
jgi:hypothetical protein